MPKVNEPDQYASRITDWPLEERPRERLTAEGAENISSAELIAILLGQGTRKYNAVDLARKLLRRFGSLEALSDASLDVILLDSALKKIRDFEVTQGILDASLVHPREVFKPAIRYSARGVIVLHNHPSGELKPSDQDIKTTEQLINSGKILGIPVYDHLIITQDGFYSFKDHGMIR